MRKRFLGFWWVGALSLLIGILGVVIGIWITYLGYSESHRVSNPRFEVRLMKKVTILFNYTYLFQSKDASENEWNDVFWYTSDPDDEKSMIQIVSDMTGYIKSPKIFAITRDAGRSWSYFGLDEVPRIPLDALNCTFIDKVDIGSNGEGTMKLRGCSQTKSLATSDYGATWQ